MALHASSQWEVRPSDVDGNHGYSLNGGGRVACNYVSAVEIADGGTSYEVNDVLTVTGGTNLGVACTLKVTSVAAGVIDGIEIVETGAYTVNPTNPVATTGHTTDATFNLTLTAATDYSIQNAPAVTWIHGAGGTGTLGNYEDDLGGTNATPTVLTSVAGAARFVGAIVGNTVNITAGTNELVGRYQVVSVQVGVNATLDRLATDGVGALIEGTAYLGGAVNSLADIGTIIVGGNTVWINATGHSDVLLAGSLTTAAGAIATPIDIRGYYSTRGDIDGGAWATWHNSYGFIDTTNMPTLALADTKALTLGTFTNVAGLNITGNVSSGLILAGVGSYCCTLYRCRVINASGNVAAKAVNWSRPGLFVDCELSAATTSAGNSVTTTAYSSFDACRITSANGHGIVTSANAVVRNCVFYDFAASEIAIKIGQPDLMTVVADNTFDRVLGTCITVPDSAEASPLIHLVNNQVTNCGTFCDNLRFATSTIPLYTFNNRTLDNGTTYGAGAGRWKNSAARTDALCTFNDVATDAGASSTEYVDEANKDFHLKTGALGKGVGLPPATDIGAWQRTEGAGGKVRTLPLEG